MEEKKKEAYVLIGIERMEELLKAQFMMSQSVLLFEYLCSQSRYPLFLSAKSAFFASSCACCSSFCFWRIAYILACCEVLGLNPETLEQCRRKRTIRARVVGRQFLYNAYDLVALSCKLNQRKIQRVLRNIPKVTVH